MTARTQEASTEVREYRQGPYTISTDRSRVDVALVHRFLSTEFWDTEGISRERLDRALRHSVCFGIYDERGQVGFARVVTDRATFAFVSDDFVLPAHRGRGLATWLMQCILEHPDVAGLHRVLLVTRDPRLYAKAGFAAPEPPEQFLERRAPPRG
jgi:GNAT superfamily N-acetyltransferase